MCGSGRFLVPFMDRGFDICGIDLSAHMLDRLKKKAPSAKAVQADILEYDSPDRFDYIFMDPPYNQELERQALSCLETSALIDKQSTIIIEASLETSFDYLESMGFLMEKNKQYKTNRHVFVYRGE